MLNKKTIKEFLKPDWKKVVLTFLLLLVCFLFFVAVTILPMPVSMVPVVVGLLLVLFLPFALVYNLLPFGVPDIVALIIAFSLHVFYFYTISCFLVCLLARLKNLIVSIKWSKWGVKTLGALAGIAVIGIAVYGFLNLGWTDIFIPTADDSGATPEGVAEVVKANNQFAIRLYSEISKKSNGNIFFSPWSISTAMAMAYEGARGQTADEIRSVFQFPEDNDRRRFSFARLLNTANKTGGKYEFHVANAIWLQKDYPFLEEYKNTIWRYYLGEIRNMDFVNDAAGSSNEINNWVAGHTNNKIREIVHPEMFNELTRAVLTNAIYFKGKWEHQFDKQRTKPEDFTLRSGKKVKVPMMQLTDSDLEFNYAEMDGVQILEMKYQGDKISMLVLLPKTNIHYLESILTEERLQKWRNSLKPETVYIYIPKYKFETSYSLTDYLKDMGMHSPFEWPGADFSGIDGTKMLYISDILHKAYVDVYEEGTEAAAATTILVMIGAAPKHPVIFRADHPFIFIIQESKTGNILFIGRVMQPVGY